MTKRSLAPLAFALLACLPAHAAPKKKAAPAPAKETAAQEATAQEIDVDAMARAKDGKPTEPLAEPVAAPAAKDAPVAAEPAATKPPPAPAEAATSEAAPASNHTTTAAPAQAPAGSAATTAEPAADATPKTAAAPAADAPMTEQPSPLAPQPAPDVIEKSIAAGCEARAAALLDAAQKADYATATRDFDAKMRSALPAPKFQQAWESLAQFGHLQARGQAHPMKGDGYIAITVPLIFDKANLYAQIACGSDGRIAGFYVKPL